MQGYKSNENPNIREALDNTSGPPTDHAQVLTEYGAIFGYLLHEATEPPTSLTGVFVDSRSKVFSSSFPGLEYLLQALPLEKPLEGPSFADPMESFLFRFSPSPWSDSSALERYPPVEIKVRINPESGEPESPEIKAIHSESMVDLLLPNQACDVRFLRRSIIPIVLDAQHVNGKANEAEVNRFLAESHLNPFQELKLRAYPHIKLLTPPWENLSLDSVNTRSGGMVDYLLTGMEHRRLVTFNWKTFPVMYTTIDGGLSGGRSSEVRMLCKPTDIASEHMDAIKNTDEGMGFNSNVSDKVFSNFLERTSQQISRLGAAVNVASE